MFFICKIPLKVNGSYDRNQPNYILGCIAHTNQIQQKFYLKECNLWELGWWCVDGDGVIRAKFKSNKVEEFAAAC